MFCIKMINQAQNYYFFYKYANNFGKNVKKAYFCKIELAKFAQIKKFAYLCSEFLIVNKNR